MVYRKLDGKPHPSTKVQRNDILVRYYKEHPESTLNDIGQVFNISSARVLQIVQRAQKESDGKAHHDA